MYVDATVDHYLPYRYVYHYHNYAEKYNYWFDCVIADSSLFNKL